MFIFAIFTLWGILVRIIGADDVWPEPNVAEDNWLVPNAWELHSLSQETCPVCDISEATNENGITTKFYKEMVAQLFNRDNLKVNPKTGYLQRTIILSLTTSQLQIIEKSSDIRDFNSVVMAVVGSAKEPDLEQSKSKNTENSLWSLLKFIGGLFKTMASLFVSFLHFLDSEAGFVLLLCATMLAIWLIHKRYKKNIIIVLIVSFILFGYIFTYLECNRELAAEDFIEFIEKNQPDTPNFITKMANFFKLSEKQEKIEKIRKETKIKLGICRPDVVAIKYFNQMFFNQLKVLIEEMVTAMNYVRESIPFPFNYMGMLAIPFIFMTMLPLLFQYIFNPLSWHQIFHRVPGAKEHQTLNNNNSHQGDQLSGDNLKILFEVLKNKTEVKEKPTNSAVEEIIDLPQLLSGKLDDSLNAEETSDGKDFPQRLAAKLDDSLNATSDEKVADEDIKELEEENLKKKA